MDVSQKIDPGIKARLRNLNLECQVLHSLLAEKERAKQEMMGLTLKALNSSPALYALKVDFAADKWELVLKPGALTLPGQNGTQVAIERRLS